MLLSLMPQHAQLVFSHLVITVHRRCKKRLIKVDTNADFVGHNNTMSPLFRPISLLGFMHLCFLLLILFCNLVSVSFSN